MLAVEEKLDSFLSANLDHYIQEISELCAQPSVSARREGTHECAELVKRILERHGFQVQKFATPGSPVVVGQARGSSKRTLLLYNHYDVQPPEPLELWTTPPFQPTVREGALYARGAADDKGEIIARMAAVEAVRAAHGGELPCNITCVIEGDEEIASPHMPEFVRQHVAMLECQGAIWEGGGIGPDGTIGTTVGCRGVIGVELTAETLKADAHSGQAEFLPNAAWRLLRALSCLKDANERILIPGFYEHALSPSRREVELLDSLPDEEATLKEMYGVKEFVGGLKGKEINRAVYNCTCNIDGLNAGYQGEGMKTVIPARAIAKIDFRLVPDQDPDDILLKLRAYLDQTGFGDVSVKKIGAMLPYRTAAEDPFIQLAARTAESLYPPPYRIIPLVGGSSPVQAFAGQLGGIPVIFAGVGYWDNRGHSPNEHVRLSDFLLGSRHLSRILDGFGDLPDHK